MLLFAVFFFWSSYVQQSTLTTLDDSEVKRTHSEFNFKPEPAPNYPNNDHQRQEVARLRREYEDHFAKLEAECQARDRGDAQALKRFSALLFEMGHRSWQRKMEAHGASMMAYSQQLAASGAFLPSSLLDEVQTGVLLAHFFSLAHHRSQQRTQRKNPKVIQRYHGKIQRMMLIMIMMTMMAKIRDPPGGCSNNSS